MANIEIQVPDIGDFDEVTVIELLVKVGDTIKAEQSLITVESDKASMEIPSAAAGVVTAIKVALGDKVKQGSLVVMLEVAEGAAAPVASAEVIAPAAAPAPVAAAPAAAETSAPVPAAPAITAPAPVPAPALILALFLILSRRMTLRMTSCEGLPNRGRLHLPSRIQFNVNRSLNPSNRVPRGLAVADQRQLERPHG